MLLSIIIPIYNAENYIYRCFRSILCQNLKHTEIIIIDDGSIDNSKEIVKEIIRNYKSQINLQFIDNEINMGVAYSRNLGLRKANGEYVTFIDVDDFVSANYFEKIFNEIFLKKSDIVIFSYQEIKKGATLLRVIDPEAQNHNSAVSMLLSNKLHNCLWNKVFRRSLFVNNNIVINKGLNMFEDKSICFKLFYFASSISVISTPLYFYDRSNLNAITKLKIQSHIKFAIKVVNIIDEFFSCHEHDILVTNSILINKLHVAGMIALYGNSDQRKMYFPILGKFPLHLYLYTNTIPFHYRLCAWGYYNHCSIMSYILKKMLCFYQHYIKK